MTSKKPSRVPNWFILRLIVAVCGIASVTSYAMDEVVLLPRDLDADEVDRLAKLLEAEDPLTRLRAAVAIGEVCPLGTRAIPALVKAGRSGDRYMRIAVARALELLETVDSDALELLRSMTADEAACVRTAAIRALYELEDGSEKTRAALTKALKHSMAGGYFPEFALCLEALDSIGVDIDRVLRGELTSPSVQARLMAAQALAAQGAKDRAVLEVLERQKDNQDPAVKAFVARVLARIQPDAPNEKEHPTAPAPAPVPPPKDF